MAVFSLAPTEACLSLEGKGGWHSWNEIALDWKPGPDSRITVGAVTHESVLFSHLAPKEPAGQMSRGITTFPWLIGGVLLVIAPGIMSLGTAMLLYGEWSVQCFGEYSWVGTPHGYTKVMRQNLSIDDLAWDRPNTVWIKDVRVKCIETEKAKELGPVTFHRYNFDLSNWE